MNDQDVRSAARAAEEWLAEVDRIIDSYKTVHSNDLASTGELNSTRQIKHRHSGKVRQAWFAGQCFGQAVEKDGHTTYTTGQHCNYD